MAGNPTKESAAARERFTLDSAHVGDIRGAFGTIGQRPSSSLLADRSRDGVLVVDQKEDQRDCHDAGQIRGLMEIAFGRRAFSKVHGDRCLNMPNFESPGQPDRMRQLRPD